MTDQGDRLDAVIDWLADGKLSTAEAAAKVRGMKFPAGPQRGAYKRLAHEANGDSAVPEHGAFFHVSAAYTEGRLTRVQYEALAQAATEAMKATDA